MAQRPAPTPPRWRDLRWSSRLCILCTLFGLLLVGGEVLARAYWCIAWKVPAFRTQRIATAFFPELRKASIHEAPESRDDEVFDVLILGASVWHERFGDLGPRFQTALEERLGRRVRVWNIAHPGRTSLDSRLRYRHLANKRFDLVVVYHAINDCYMNNCPSHVYRPDYRHSSRFHQIALLDQHPEHPYTVLPYTARFAASRFLASRFVRNSRFSHEPGPRFFDCAREVKTAGAFEANFTDIVEEAKRRGDPVLLMTFATYIPDGYTEEAFSAHQTDYSDHTFPVRQWGTTASVPAVVAAHNAVIRRLVAQHPEVLFVDQERTMPAGKRYYDDPCHLTLEGCEAFVGQMMKQVDWNKVQNGPRAKDEGRTTSRSPRREP